MGSSHPFGATAATTVRRQRATTELWSLAVVGFIGLCACTDDGGNASAVSASAEACTAYAEAELAVDELAGLDVLAADQEEAAADVEAVVTSITTLSEVAQVDDEDVLQDIEAVLAEIPPGEDPQESQLALQALRDSRDIIVADVRTWLEGSGIDCR